MLSQNGFGFRVPHFGQGLDMNIGIALARELGETTLGLGVGYLSKGGFTPRAGDRVYLPGDELTMTAGLGRQVLEGDGRLLLDVVYTRYGEDRQGGERVFKAGQKVLVQALGLFKLKEMDWRFYLAERSRGRNTNYQAAFSDEWSNGNQLEFGLAVTKSVSQAVGLRLIVNSKLYGDSGFDTDDRAEVLLFGGGPGVRLKWSPQRFVDIEYAILQRQKRRLYLERYGYKRSFFG